MRGISAGTDGLCGGACALGKGVLGCGYHGGAVLRGDPQSCVADGAGVGWMVEGGWSVDLEVDGEDDQGFGSVRERLGGWRC